MEVSLKDFISSLQIPFRGDCPVCHNHNTFSANNVNGVVFYYCFHANCKLKGRFDADISIDDISRGQYNSTKTYDNNILDKTYVIPDYFASPLQNPQCLAFLKRWNLLDKYVKGLELYYDPKQKRCVFPLRNHEGVLKGATGRSVNYVSFPKWFIYNRLDNCPYNMGGSTRTERAILVEDCISAVIGSSLCSTIGLLGTNINIDVYKYFKLYDKLYIALDYDATGKSIKLQKELSVIKPTYILPLTKDIKYYNIQELEELKKCIS